MNKSLLAGWCLVVAVACSFAACGGGDTTDLFPELPDGVEGDLRFVDQGTELATPPDGGGKDQTPGFDVDVSIPDTGIDLVYPDVEDPDVPTFELPLDVSVEVEPTLCAEDGGFGCDCESNDDCNSGWCVETPGGYMCSQTCVEECPEGWTCTLVQDPPDTVGVCMSAHPTLCNPCAKNQECQGTVVGLQVLCVDMGGQGSYCGGDCSDDGNACPAGYACDEVTSVDGTEGLQCVPTAGICLCSPLAIELSLATDCHIENEFGLCEGEKICEEEGLSDCSAGEPAPETCNGEDDDCNGVADDDLIQEECQVINQYGACPGTVLCVGGQPLCQGKEAAAETCDGLDNDCDALTDEDFGDCDQDGISDCIETDDDADGWPDDLDNCPCFQNPAQTNFDFDEQGDACDPDDDNDGSADDQDCAPLNSAVYPGVPEECNGADDDCDELVDEGYLDTDQDGQADCVDLDDDGDASPDTLDNCPNLPNEDQLDTDFDGQGDVCDPDDDADGYPDDNDCDPLDKNVHEGAAELCDCKDNNCNGTADEGFTDTDGDGIADCCEDDTDGDGVPNGLDNCPFDANADQLNTDGDLSGDACDPDDDNDGVVDELDCNPTEVKAYPNAPEICDGVDNDCDGVVDNAFPDHDEDGMANCVDPDDDGDGVADQVDLCPFFPDPLQLDTDGDGFGNACDGDDDGDGDFDLTDCEPLNPQVNHDATEFCNGKDDDCDNKVDEEGAGGCIPLFPDVDEDGFGQDGGDKCLCFTEPPYTSFQGGDCNDNSDAQNPLIPEVCNGVDDDCDGEVDSEDSAGCVDYFSDVDEDGFGVLGVGKKCLCDPEAPFTAQEVGDCGPDDPEVFPGNMEVCDDLDNDCNGAVDDVDNGNCI